MNVVVLAAGGTDCDSVPGEPITFQEDTGDCQQGEAGAGVQNTSIENGGVPVEVANMSVGGSGGEDAVLQGMTPSEGCDGALTLFTFAAITVNVYSLPPVRPGTTVDVTLADTVTGVTDCFAPGLATCFEVEIT